MERTYTMDSPIITFKNLNGDVQMSWDVWKAVEGTIIFGAIGSGKTSGSGRTLAIKKLMMGFGGLVLTAKPDEKETWVEYCRIAGRLDDLVVIEPGGNYFFNFLEYESTDKSNSKSYTQNIVQVLKTVIQASEEKSGGKSDDPFWGQALDMLLYNAIELCILAYGKATVENLYDIVLSAPKPNDEQKQDKDKTGSFAFSMNLAKLDVQQHINAFKQGLTSAETDLLSTPELIEKAIVEAVPEAARLKAVVHFFTLHYLNLSEKTRSIVDFSFTGFLFRLLKDPAYSLFSKNPSNVVPEDCLKGKIIIINLPVKLYDNVGRDCQTMFKYIWQRAIERRDVNENGRPVFLWADEAQNFLHAYDTEFQSTARSSRVATVYISQNIPNYYAFMGGTRYKEKISSLFGNLGTKIFHANTDIETNKYASELFGDEEVDDKSVSENFGSNFSFGSSESKKIKRRVRPEEFVKLKSGGSKNECLVDAYFLVQGNPFTDGLNFRKVTFYQKYEPNIS